MEVNKKNKVKQKDKKMKTDNLDLVIKYLNMASKLMFLLAFSLTISVVYMAIIGIFYSEDVAFLVGLLLGTVNTITGVISFNCIKKGLFKNE